MSRDRRGKRLWALDGLNFWIADVQTGVGPFVAAALTARGWKPEQAGALLNIAGVAGLITQTPSGAVVDATRRKRTVIALAVAALVAGALILAYGTRYLVLVAGQILLGGVAPLIAAAITAISLGLVGRQAFDARVGRNATFNAAGNVAAALLMGWAGWKWGPRSIFLTVPFLAIPAVAFLAAIPAGEIDHARARGADDGVQTQHGSGLRVIVSDRALLTLSAAAVLFHFSNAAMLPQLGEVLARGNPRSAAPFMSAAVSITQSVIALTAAGFGKLCARWGPKPLLLLGFGVLPIRGLLYTLTSATPQLLAIQTLDGIANGIFAIATAVYIAARTRGTGHFNLAMGGFGTAVGIGASFSPLLAGFIAARAGFSTSFLVLAGIAGVAFLGLLLVPANPSRERGQVPLSKDGNVRELVPSDQKRKS